MFQLGQLITWTLLTAVALTNLRAKFKAHFTKKKNDGARDFFMNPENTSCLCLLFAAALRVLFSLQPKPTIDMFGKQVVGARSKGKGERGLAFVHSLPRSACAFLPLALRLFHRVDRSSSL